MLKLKVIACDVLNREISYLSSQSKHFVDVTYLYQGLHCTPDKLCVELQQAIDKVDEEGFPYNYYGTSPEYDYIILGYGLCSNGVVGISSKKTPLIIPRGHDCITLLLGSKERYKEYFEKNSGTYWYSSGWIERGGQPSEERYKAAYNNYVEKYGEDNAEYLMEMEQGWLKEYKSATYVDWDIFANSKLYSEYTRKSTEYLNWEYNEVTGDVSLLRRLLDGEFNESEVLIVPPGKKPAPSYDENVIKVED